MIIPSPAEEAPSLTERSGRASRQARGHIANPPPFQKDSALCILCLSSVHFPDSENSVVPRLWFPSWKRPGEVLPAKIAVLVSLVNIYGVASRETEAPALKNLTMSGTRLTQETIKCSVVCGTDQQDNGTSELGQFQQWEGY